LKRIDRLLTSNLPLK